MIRNTYLSLRNYYYPLGNTAAVSLTQDLPPEQDADILLLGCGDARSILFTCFADNARKMDVTCCDIEPAVHARNVLLYSLLIEDKENCNVDCIWNIYYHWKLDKESMELLGTQSQKLLQVSGSIDQWHGSAYGSNVRFCDERSLSLVRSHWKGYHFRGMSRSKKVECLSRLQAVFNNTINFRKKVFRTGCVTSDTRMASPVGEMALEDVSDITDQWWDCGTTPSSSSSARVPTEFNPAFLYSPDRKLNLYYALSPVECFPLNTAYVPITKGSGFHQERKGPSSTKHLVNCVKIHFSQWASAYRKAVKNGLVVRIITGDALAFCCTLRNCQLTGSRSVNLFADSWTNGRLELHHCDYGNDKNAAPLSFDVIDTSNLVDHLGPLNVMITASSLLKPQASSTFYTQMFIQCESKLTDRLFGFFGVDTRLMALLLGLVLPDLFTNASNSVEDEDNCMIDKFQKLMSGTQKRVTSVRSRLRWKRLRGYQESSIHLEATKLSKILIQVHNAMFKHENPNALLRLYNPCYTRASFALLLNLLRSTVDSDWDRCVRLIYDSIFSGSSPGPITQHYSEDLLLNMRLYGIDNGSFKKPAPSDVSEAILAPILPFSAAEDVPEVLCVTIRVPREQLKVFTSINPEEMGSPALVCSFEGKDPGSRPWLNHFSSIQLVFGTLREGVHEDNSCLHINEDNSQLLGTSDMFASVLVPTSMLLQSKRSVPIMKCGLIPSRQNSYVFEGELGPDLCFTRSKMTGKDVFVTRHMPGMSALPAFAVVSAPQDKPPSVATTVRLTHDGSKIDTLVRRITLESEAVKAKFAVHSSIVEVKFESPFKACVSIAQSFKFNLEFPVPVSPSKHKVKIARTSSYIEVEAPLLDPLVEDAVSFLLPTFISKIPCGVTVPVPWSFTRIDLDAMPPVDLKDRRILLSLAAHTFLMFSERERRTQESIRTNPSIRQTQTDIRTDLKKGLYSIFFEYLGLRGKQQKVFMLSEKLKDVDTIIIPSCLRLDLVNRTVVLDTAMIPATDAMHNDPRACRFLQELANRGLCSIDVKNHTWKALMPALVERCRTSATWKHAPNCEYIEAGEVPLSKGLNGNRVSPICSCGIGEFPSDYLGSQTKMFSDLSYMVDNFATRAAVTPIFSVPYIEDLLPKGFASEVLLGKDFPPKNFSKKDECVNCGKHQREKAQSGEHGLLRCSRCKLVQYCSKECQKADWKRHKPLCAAA